MHDLLLGTNGPKLPLGVDGEYPRIPKAVIIDAFSLHSKAAAACGNMGFAADYTNRALRGRKLSRKIVFSKYTKRTLQLNA